MNRRPLNPWGEPVWPRWHYRYERECVASGSMRKATPAESAAMRNTEVEIVARLAARLRRQRPHNPT